MGFALTLIDFICAFLFIKYPGSIENEDEVESRIYEEKNDLPTYTVPALEYAAPTFSERKFDRDDFDKPVHYQPATLTSPSNFQRKIGIDQKFLESTKSRVKSQRSLRRSKPGSIVAKAPDFV